MTSFCDITRHEPLRLQVCARPNKPLMPPEVGLGLGERGVSMMLCSGHAQGWHSRKTSCPLGPTSSLRSPEWRVVLPLPQGKKGWEDLRIQQQRHLGTPGVWAHPEDSDVAPHV